MNQLQLDGLRSVMCRKGFTSTQYPCGDYNVYIDGELYHFRINDCKGVRYIRSCTPVED